MGGPGIGLHVGLGWMAQFLCSILCHLLANSSIALGMDDVTFYANNDCHGGMRT